MGNRIALNIRLPEETIKGLKARAKRLHISQTQFVESLLNDALGLSEESFDPSPPLPMEDRIDAIEKAIATLEQKINDFSEKSPSRMASGERNEPVRTNHPESTNEPATWQKNVDLSSGLSQAEFKRHIEGLGYKADDSMIYRWVQRESCPRKGKNKELSKMFEIRDGLFYPINSSIANVME